jgi:hypothetical protein
MARGGAIVTRRSLGCNRAVGAGIPRHRVSMVGQPGEIGGHCRGGDLQGHAARQAGEMGLRQRNR